MTRTAIEQLHSQVPAAERTNEACVRCGMFCANIEITAGVMICRHCVRVLNERARL